MHKVRTGVRTAPEVLDIRLRRGVDDIERDFYFTSDGLRDDASIKQFCEGSPEIFLVTQYDQNGNHHLVGHATVIPK